MSNTNDLFGPGRLFGRRVMAGRPPVVITPSQAPAYRNPPPTPPATVAGPPAVAYVPFRGAPGSDQGAWFAWNTAAPLAVALPAGLTVRALWFPQPSGARVAVFSGGGNSPLYVTTGASEVVPLPPNVGLLSLVAPPKAPATMYVYAYSGPWEPFVAANTSAALPYDQAVALLGPFHDYPMNDAPGQTTLVDYALVGTNGNAGGGGVGLGTAPVTGDSETSYNLPGGPAPPYWGNTGGNFLPDTAPWSFVVWIRAGNPNSNTVGTIFSNQRYDPPPGTSTKGLSLVWKPRVGYNFGTVSLIMEAAAGGGAFYMVSIPGVTYGAAHMLYGAWDGNKLLLSIDLQSPTVTPAPDANMANVKIAVALGVQPFGTQNAWTGAMAKLFVMNRLLTTAEQTTLFIAGQGG